MTGKGKKIKKRDIWKEKEIEKEREDEGKRRRRKGKKRTIRMKRGGGRERK